ncbi:PH domain-containing protein, partial [Georgenia sp. 10Sc9-8]|nr:PH domain-containing protein [Georgenia halotolerans]
MDETPEEPTDGAGPATEPVDPERDWRRVHKITPVLNAWKVIVAVVAVLVFNNFEVISSVMEERDEIPWGTVWLVGGGAVLLFLTVLGTYSALAWQRMRYAVGDEAVYLHQGILFRSQRHARLNRVQAVDVVQPLLGRLFGLAQIKVESAGGQGSNVTIAYLREPEAQELRNEILARAAGLPVDRVEAADGAPAPPPQAAPERELLRVPPGRLVGSLMLSGTLGVFLLVVGGLAVSAIVAESLAPLSGALPAVVGWGGFLWNRFAGEFHFRAAISPDGIRLRHGLLETRAQTLPPGRIQALQLTQPLLWRRPGWWRVEVDVAGYGAEAPGSNGAVQTVLLPVGPRGDALTAMWLVLHDLGVGDPAAVLDAALEGQGEDVGFRTSPRRARWLDPFLWRRTGLRITDTALLMRSGRFNRAMTVVPHERTQSLGVQQGPLERRLGLADLVVHTVPGPVNARVPHLDAAYAGTVLREQAERARTARAGEGPEEWMLRVGVPAQEPGTDPAQEPGTDPAQEPGTDPAPGGTEDGGPW